MILLPPIANFEWTKNVSQLFGVSAQTYQSKFGLPGHNGIDIIIKDEKQGYGSPVHAIHAGVVESIIYDVPHKTRGNGISVVSDDKTFSTIYWHLSNFQVQVGQHVEAWSIIGLMGNSGFVLSNGQLVLIEDRLKYPYKGTHCHLSCPPDTMDRIDMSIDIKFDLITTITLTLIAIRNFLDKK